MRLRVLGTAAGGGVPQWNCACPGCAAARARPGLRRRHASLAVQAGDGRWYAVNATPDIAEQTEAFAELHPGPGLRDTPLAGVLLTDGELDHTTGLFRLREARGLRVLATPTVRGAVTEGLRLDAVLGPYTALRWEPLPTDRAVPLDEEGSIEVRALPVSGKRPRYAAELDPPGADWSVALCLTDRRDGRTLVYAPALADWPADFDELVRQADCVLLDGTFWDDQEPVRAGFGTRTARQMGHLPITGPGGTAERLAPLTGVRRLYTHLNNTNPLVDPDAAEHQVLAALGIAVAQEEGVITP
ncbi:pyrroloquinoline quinone biosynthesis protein PqqB [Kitasatospora viridis]|uniref:Coenzyme PQQ synthesis protein B n=1 Tax=Kitasatospora viridis TaxID=281105 RepID=A0A561UCI0_9ACTN|nr:pyrroloquinoline quinone biosynthesis protein PqqB [Kitasatospora viridis]TWF97049.1 pyrroloquinoline quinone biosynthesis protein B [Kitasatospora viridis]